MSPQSRQGGRLDSRPTRSEPQASGRGLLQRVAQWFGRGPRDGVRVRVIAKGRMGEDWFDFDRKLSLPRGATLADLIATADRLGMRLSAAIASSPHLRHTLMWNGQRTPVDENLGRELSDGDEVYLLGPVAGG